MCTNTNEFSTMPKTVVMLPCWLTVPKLWASNEKAYASVFAARARYKTNACD